MDAPDQPVASHSRPASKYGAREWLFLIVAVVPILAVAGSCMFLVILAGYWRAGPYEGRAEGRFTQAAWLAAAEDSNGLRFLMLEDLLRKEPLVGRTRADVEALLGPLIPPTDPPYSGWCYYLGPEPGALSMDSIWLDIDFNAADVVVGHHTWRD